MCLTFEALNVKQEKIEELNAPTKLLQFTKVYMKVTSKYFKILTGNFPFSRNSCELTYISCKKYWDLREVSKVSHQYLYLDHTTSMYDLSCKDATLQVLIFACPSPEISPQIAMTEF